MGNRALAPPCGCRVDGEHGTLFEFCAKQANPKALVIGYSTGASAVSGCRCILQSIAKEGLP